MDLTQYKDIAPYRGQDVRDAITRVLANKDAIHKILASVGPAETEEQQKLLSQYADHIVKNLEQVTNYDEFQKYITAGIFLPAIIQKSVDTFSFSGMEHTTKEQSYLFMSNHRDIVLDCALIDMALLKGDRMLCEMAIGDNLLTNQFVTDLFKLNGGVTVKRTLPMREKYLESIRLSSYFVELITEENKSIWVAQKSGRAKDGLDVTTPAIIKMLHLSQKSKGISFSEVVNSCRIVPVAVSYEYDPCDLIKAGEEVARLSRGEHAKKRYEDLISISRGMKGHKGNVHIAFGKPIAGEFENSEQVAQEVDRQIHTLYRLWPTNLFAYDYLENSTRFASSYQDFDKEAFLYRFKGVREDVRAFALNAYANPVRSYLAVQQS
ncbi:1-acyl-sn-glycerol-3-phosphate acyltransferase [Sphaerochaeta sp.]|uniref:1-acyl-sn-glycerol-3-phosphate acyltransferase n=1 Tax=Sphaerochaeta sp. TaxID=1972642 RepID=UPI003D0A769F